MQENSLEGDRYFLMINITKKENKAESCGTISRKYRNTRESSRDSLFCSDSSSMEESEYTKSMATFVKNLSNVMDTTNNSETSNIEDSNASNISVINKLRYIKAEIDSEKQVIRIALTLMDTKKSNAESCKRRRKIRRDEDDPLIGTQGSLSYPFLEDKEMREYAEIARKSFTEKEEIFELEEESNSKEENQKTFFATK